MAHELRTPLTIIRARVDSLEPGPLRDELRTDLVEHDAHRQPGARHRRARELHRRRRRPRRPAGGLRRGRGLHGAACRRRSPRPSRSTGAEGPVWVRGHAEALFRAVRNLVENAIRHTPAGVLDRGRGLGRRHGARARRRAGRARGRPRIDLPALLAARPRARPTAAAWASRSWPASPRAHDGSVTVENRPGGGAVFTLSCGR